MKIGVDIDGVMTDLRKYQLEKSIDYFKKLGYELINPNGCDIKSMFNLPSSLVSQFWVDHIEEYFNMPPRSEAIEYINKLKKEGNEIYIITSRGSNREEEVLGRNNTIDFTINYLSKYGICYDDIVFTTNGKLDACLKLNIDIMIDDMGKNINEVSSKVKCIIYDEEYNRDVFENSNIIRCYSWSEIYDKIHELSK